MIINNLKGCVNALENSIKDYILIIGYVGCLICLTQALGILFSIFLIKELKKSSLYKPVKSSEY